MPMKNDCLASGSGPPSAPCDRRLPAFLSRACAVNSPISKATICCASPVVRSRTPSAWRRVAALAWCGKSCSIVLVDDDSRPSHMIALRKRTLDEGSGRRHSDASLVAGPHWLGSATRSMTNSAPAGALSPIRMRPRFRSRLYAACSPRGIPGGRPHNSSHRCSRRWDPRRRSPRTGSGRSRA